MKKLAERRHAVNRAYLMRVSGGLVKHLGLQMYSGAVPAIAELVSNAWDAMARNVWITIPLYRALTEDDRIEVRDDGHGMTHVECNDAYLVIGRDRRRAEGDRSRPYNGLAPRRLQSRKGIGKLSGFGIANRIEVRTRANGEVSHFALDYDEIVQNKDFVSEGGYRPGILPGDGKRTRRSPGTKIRLSQLKIRRAIPTDQFVRSMARRFSILGSAFRIHVNGTLITKDEFPFQFRFPEKPGEWENVDLPNGQHIRWWAGFTRSPIPDEEARGFVVYVRGKLAQTPWFFDLSGGAWGQHGLQYLTGEVIADFLDDTEGVDLVATDRGTIRWEEPLAQPVKEWGLKKVRELLERWAEKRRKAKIKTPEVVRYLDLAQRLPEREQRIFKTFVDRIASIPQVDEDAEGRDILNDLVEFGFNALTNRSLLEIIQQLNATSPEDRKRFTDALKEWDIIEAVSTARLVKGRVEIIRKFSQLIGADAREKPEMQIYLKEHPWLIDPAWSMLAHEKQLDTIIRKEFNLSKSGIAGGRERLDFFCLGDKYKVAHVVELKRPGKLATRGDLDQLRNYVLFLRDKLQKSTSDSKYRRTDVAGLLVCSGVRSSDDAHAEVARKGGVLEVRTWDNLLLLSEQLHGEFLEVVKDRAPSDDPRMQDLRVSASRSVAPRAGQRGRSVKRQPGPKN